MLKFRIFIIITLIFSVNCFSQDSTKIEKVLFIKCTKPINSEGIPVTRTLNTGRRVKIKLYNQEQIISGNLKSIGDSSININGNTILLKDIKEISSLRGKLVPCIGAVVAISSFGLICYGGNDLFDYGNNSAGLDVFVGAIGFAIGIGTTVGGIINLIAVRHYHLDKDFKMSVKTIIKK